MNGELIQKVLKNLPKTLYETYDRVLSAAPEEERLSANFALQWIAHHNELHSGEGIPYKVLIEAAEASILNFTGHRNERFYDKDTLREVCGCLIDISPQDLKNHTYMSVNFAHYSVREYLDSDRTLDAVFGHCTIGGGNPKDRLLEITLSEAQRVEPDELRGLGTDSTNDSDVIRMENSKFNAYCVVSALLSLRQFPNRICQESTLKALAIDLLDPSMPHFSTMEHVALAIDRAQSFLPLDLAEEELFWDIEWHPDTRTELKHLYNLLHLTQSVRECLALTKTFLQGKDTKSLLPAQVRFSRRMRDAYSFLCHGTYVFQGSFVEIFAQQALYSVNAFRFLMEVGAGLFDPSITLLLYIGHHNHWLCKRVEFCPLRRLLDIGADPNLPGYRITPLQIATFTRDYDGVERLLKAGALPNDTGSPDGVIWGEDSITHHWNHLNGLSPHKICKRYSHTWSSRIETIEESLSKQTDIEKLLLHHGASEFRRSGGLDKQESEDYYTVPNY